MKKLVLENKHRIVLPLFDTELSHTFIIIQYISKTSFESINNVHLVFHRASV